MHLRNLIPIGATCAVLRSWPQILVLLFVLVVVVLTVACFLRWFTKLSVARRADILRLIEALHGR